MLEIDMSDSGVHEWICLYRSSSILEPGSVSAVTPQLEAGSPMVTQVNAAHAVGPERPFQMLIRLGSLPFI